MIGQADVVGLRTVDSQRCLGRLAGHLHRRAAGVGKDQLGGLYRQVGFKLHVDAAADHSRERTVVLINHRRRQLGVLRVEYRKLDPFHSRSIDHIDFLNLGLQAAGFDIIVERPVDLPQPSGNPRRVALTPGGPIDLAQIDFGLLPTATDQAIVNHRLTGKTVTVQHRSDFNIAILDPLDTARKRYQTVPQRRRDFLGGMGINFIRIGEQPRRQQQHGHSQHCRNRKDSTSTQHRVKTDGLTEVESGGTSQRLLLGHGHQFG